MFKAKEKIIGADITKSVSPAQMVIKLVQDELTEMLGSEHQELDLAAAPPPGLGLPKKSTVGDCVLVIIGLPSASY